LLKWICKLISTNVTIASQKYLLITSKTDFPTVSKFVHTIFFNVLGLKSEKFNWHHLLVGKLVILTEDKMLSEFRVKQKLIWKSSFQVYFRIGIFWVLKVLFSFRPQCQFRFHFSWLIMIFCINVKQIWINSLHCTFRLFFQVLTFFCLFRNKSWLPHTSIKTKINKHFLSRSRNTQCRMLMKTNLY